MVELLDQVEELFPVLLDTCCSSEVLPRVVNVLGHSETLFLVVYKLPLHTILGLLNIEHNRNEGTVGLACTFLQMYVSEVKVKLPGQFLPFSALKVL